MVGERERKPWNGRRKGVENRTKERGRELKRPGIRGVREGGRAECRREGGKGTIHGKERGAKEGMMERRTDEGRLLFWD